MARDLRTAQRGMDVGQSDLTLEPGTPVYAINCDFQRLNVAQRRVGFDRFDQGQPWDTFETDGEADGSHISPRGYRPKWGKFHELFAKTRVFQYMGGLLYAYDDVDPDNTGWMSVPVNLSHKLRMIASYDDSTFFAYGRLVIKCPGITNGQSMGWSAWSCDSPAIPTTDRRYLVSGAIANTEAQAIDGSPTFSGDGQSSKYRTCFDVARVSGLEYISDDTTIRRFYTGIGVSPVLDGTVVAGSITVRTAWNGSNFTFSGSRFKNLEWMTTIAGYDALFVAENRTQLLILLPGDSSVQAYAGSVTAGTASTGTVNSSPHGFASPVFSNINGLCSDGVQNFFVADGNRVMMVNGGGVITLAGSVTAGYVDGNGTLARFNSINGIEFIAASDSPGMLYLCDSSNNAVRSISFNSYPPASSADVVVSTYCGGGANTSGVVTGKLSKTKLSNPILRGLVIAGDGTSSEDDRSYFASIENEITAGFGSDNILVFLRGASSPDSNRDRSLFANRSATDMPAGDECQKLDSVGFNAYGGYKTRSADCDFGSVFTSLERPRVIDEYTRVSAIDAMPRLRQLGIEQPESPSLSLVQGGTALTGGFQVAYRTVYGLNLSTGKISIGPPSDRVVISNTGITASITDINVIAYSPPSLPFGEDNIFCQVYKTLQSPSTTDPGDQMFLSAEFPVHYGVTPSVTDATPDALLGAALYTNDTEQGVESTRFPPARRIGDLAIFDSRLVSSNYSTNESVRIKILGVGSDFNVIVEMGTFVSGIGASFFLFASGASNDFNNHKFKRVTGGSAASNIDATARNLVQCINRCPDAYMFRAFIDDSDVGVIVLVAWKDNLAISISTNTSPLVQELSVDSSSQKTNALSWSDQFAFDSFPAVNEQFYGSSIEGIRRILPLSDSLLMVKDQQIRRLDTSFADQQYDNSAAGALHDTLVQLNNQWVGVFDKGVLSLTSSSALMIGKPIDRVLRSYLRPGQLDEGYGAANEQTGKYLFSIFGTFANTIKTFCLDGPNNGWSEWSMRQFQDNDLEMPAFGLGVVGSFRGVFLSSIGTPLKQVRSVFWQRDWRRDPQGKWYEDFSDVSFGIINAQQVDDNTVSADYLQTSNAMEQPPDFSGASFQGAYANNLGLIASADVESDTGSITLRTVSAVSIEQGTFTLFMPIVVQMDCGTVFAGVNSQFGDLIVSMERLQAGSLTATFYNRKDRSLPAIPLVSGSDANDPLYASAQGVERVNSMDVVSPLYAFTDPQRFAVPAERAVDQMLAIRLYEQKGAAPMAVKAISIEVRPTDSTNVKQ